MNPQKYRDQALLLLDILPDVAAEECFALHGGTAINLFLLNMPRLSVDLDLTYLPIEDRNATLSGIAAGLTSIAQRMALGSDIRVKPELEQAKLFYSRHGVRIKVEVNTTMRGALGNPVLLPLSRRAQETFDHFAEMRILSLGQLYGGKICAALDRQHPRDLFDVGQMLANYGFSDEIKTGFLLCLLSSDRPMHEIIRPTLLDQRETLENHFAGMAEESFSYEEFEVTRGTLIHHVTAALNDADRRFLLSFKQGDPAWAEYGFEDFEKFPAVRWKLQNIRKLKENNPSKHQDQLNALKNRLGEANNPDG